MNIDMHAHFVPEALLDDLAAKRHSFPSVSATGKKDAVRIAFGSQEPKRPMPAAMSDVERRRRRLAEQRIEKQVVAGWLDIFGYDLPPDEGADWSRFVNEHMLRHSGIRLANPPFPVRLGRRVEVDDGYRPAVPDRRGEAARADSVLRTGNEGSSSDPRRHGGQALSHLVEPK